MNGFDMLPANRSEGEKMEERPRGRTGNLRMNYFGNDKWKSTGKLHEKKKMQKGKTAKKPENKSALKMEIVAHGGKSDSGV